MRLSPEHSPRYGLADSEPFSITVDGVEIEAYDGDTVASALIASGRIHTAESMYRHRPRGILAAGIEEPNGLITVRSRDAHNIDETMLPVTTVPATPGLETLFVSGQGALDPRPDPALYDHKHRHVDVLIVGAGPAGIAAARSALAGQCRVALLDDQPLPGGSLLSTRDVEIDGLSGPEWARTEIEKLEKNSDFTYLPRTSAFGCYDANYVIAVENRTDHLPRAKRPGVSRQRMWQFRAAEVILATGAIERPLVFKNNDRPGIMLASAVSTYINRYGALPGHRAALFTTNDAGYESALDLAAAGAKVAAIIDARPSVPEHCRKIAREVGAALYAGSAVIDTDAGEGGLLSAVTVRGLNDNTELTSEAKHIEVDLLAVSGGYSPTVHLHTHRQGKTTWNTDIAGFVPVSPVSHQHHAGALTGKYSLEDALEEGHRAGIEAREKAAEAKGFNAGKLKREVAEAAVGTSLPLDRSPVRPVWLVPANDGDAAEWNEHFVDLQRDQAVAEIMRAYGAGMRSIEHIKRYTSIGTANDQGKTSGVNAMAILAAALGEDNLEKVGVSNYRAPYTPVPFGVIAGRERGDLFDPARLTSIHPWHLAHGAKFEDVGQWKRPWYYPQGAESMDAAVRRECAAVRESVGFMDGTTLGKIEIRGKDAAEFLDRVYTNSFRLLKVGMGRYGVMCTPDGMIFDDGVTMRLADDRFLMTTTSSGAAKVLDHLEEYSQTEWPELDVTFTSVTEQYATITVAGPKSRAVIEKLVPNIDVSAKGFPFMAFRDTTLASGIPARVCRISFSGELCFEINVEAFYGLYVWEAVEEAGREFGITPYGTETMHVLRAEKGFIIVGQDTDGTVTPQDAGMDWVVSKKKEEFLGKRSFARAHTAAPGRRHLVSVLPVDRRLRLREGAQLVEKGTDLTVRDADVTTPLLPGNGQIEDIGFVTSSYDSVALGRTFALALIERGREREGEIISSPVDGRLVDVEIGPLCLFDPEGERRDG